MSQTEDYSPKDSLSDNAEEVLQRWFSAQFYVLLEQRTPNKSGIHSFKVSRKTDQHVHSVSVRTWPLKRASYHGRRTSAGVQEGRHSIFIFNMDIPYFWSMCLFP